MKPVMGSQIWAKGFPDSVQAMILYSFKCKNPSLNLTSFPLIISGAQKTSTATTPPLPPCISIKKFATNNLNSDLYLALLALPHKE